MQRRLDQSCHAKISISLIQNKTHDDSKVPHKLISFVFVIIIVVVLDVLVTSYAKYIGMECKIVCSHLSRNVHVKFSSIFFLLLLLSLYTSTTLFEFLTEMLVFFLYLLYLCVYVKRCLQIKL